MAKGAIMINTNIPSHCVANVLKDSSLGCARIQQNRPRATPERLVANHNRPKHRRVDDACPDATTMDYPLWHNSGQRKHRNSVVSPRVVQTPARHFSIHYTILCLFSGPKACVASVASSWIVALICLMGILFRPLVKEWRTPAKG